MPWAGVFLREVSKSRLRGTVQRPLCRYGGEKLRTVTEYSKDEKIKRTGNSKKGNHRRWLYADLPVDDVSVCSNLHYCSLNIIKEVLL